MHQIVLWFFEFNLGFSFRSLLGDVNDLFVFLVVNLLNVLFDLFNGLFSLSCVIKNLTDLISSLVLLLFDQLFLRVGNSTLRRIVSVNN